METATRRGTYAARELTEADIPALLALCEGNPTYYRHCPPAVSAESLREDMRALPPGKGMEDKRYLGIFDGERLIAVMDLILRFPDERTAFIGFFMVDASQQGRGVGSRIVCETLEHLAPAFSGVRLGYVQGNEQSRRFWEKNGFTPTGVTTSTPAYTVIVMQRKL